MDLENMFKKKVVPARTDISQAGNKPEVPEGLLRKCNKCGKAIIAEEAKEQNYICPKCGGYFRIPAYRRIELLADEDSFEEWDIELDTDNPLGFKGYPEKLESLRKKTGLREAVVTGHIRIEGMEAAVGVCDGQFLMASMGRAVGEKITRLVERAEKESLPVVLFTCSGGARMQEGMVSLMQMAKTSAALKRHSDAGNLSVNVLTDPTTGGVTASFAMLGDIILAEPKALIGFAGPRVIEQTIRQKLPKGFQRSEFLLEHGFVDRIVERHSLRETLARILKLHSRNESKKIQELPKEEKRKIQKKAVRLRDIPAWERVQLSRKADRPSGNDYIQALFPDFIELHGDRCYGDDKAIAGGIAHFHGMPVTVIAQTKGNTTKENIERNFGMPAPEGYRKALRLMKQAEKFHRPVICFVDTPGAFCGLEAEERGQGEAIARNLYEMSSLQTPILSVVVGEGGSGGALALAAADEVWMLENAVYSILSPEGFASILWKDSGRAEEAARLMKMTSGDLLEQHMVEEVIPEPEELNVQTLGSVTEQLEIKISAFLEEYTSLNMEALLDRRYQRFRGM
ncbi:MAG: acetyl-CoA carboxylase carboxyltransferase subunit beta [Dorea sp.]|nr:acetyl-CoA carboxylase carboxyltransferase subunit beta [Dorea sp.]